MMHPADASAVAVSNGEHPKEKIAVKKADV